MEGVVGAACNRIHGPEIDLVPLRDPEISDGIGRLSQGERTEYEAIRAEASGQLIATRPADELIGTPSAIQDVIAIAADKAVVAIACHDGVVSSTANEHVGSRRSAERIVARLSRDEIVPRTWGPRVGGVDGGQGGDDVVARLHVRALRDLLPGQAV